MKFGLAGRVLAVALLAAPLAACGDDAFVDVSEAAPLESPLPEGPWLLRLTSLGDDEAIHHARYVWFTPATGEMKLIDAGAYFDSAEGRETTLLVDAARQWGVGSSRPQWEDGPPEVVDLDSGAVKKIDADLGEPRAWSFDPVTPGLLRVVSKDGTIRELDVESGAVEETGSLVVGGNEYGYYFDAEDGTPYVVDLGGGASRPAGLGGDAGDPVAVAGGSLVLGPLLDVPAAEQCQSEVGFDPAGPGPTTVFCLRGKRLVVRSLPTQGGSVGTVGRPLELGFRANEIDFALPPV
jgi:hypothetical protein